jgi:hypothetical protein
LRVASFAAPLSRDGPGLLLRDILSGDDADIALIAAIITAKTPDILVLTDIDYDHGTAALGAFADVLRGVGLHYPHVFSLLPNAGIATGLDLDGNSRLGEARDGQGYGRFAGNGGLAVLSRWPIVAEGVVDHTAMLWRDLPGAVLPVRDGAPFPSEAAQALQRLSSTGHWIVPVAHPDGIVTLMVWSATPPVFDGPEDMNGLRNRDELRLWSQVMDGDLGQAPLGRFVIMGNANLDPADGDGRSEAMAEFLADPRLQDPAPASMGGLSAADPGHAGDPARDTVDWPDGAPGNLRVTYVLPSADWRVADAGVFWPALDDPDAALLGDGGQGAGAHRLVWVDLGQPNQ